MPRTRTTCTRRAGSRRPWRACHHCGRAGKSNVRGAQLSRAPLRAPPFVAPSSGALNSAGRSNAAGRRDLIHTKCKIRLDLYKITIRMTYYCSGGGGKLEVAGRWIALPAWPLGPALPARRGQRPARAPPSQPPRLPKPPFPAASPCVARPRRLRHARRPPPIATTIRSRWHTP